MAATNLRELKVEDALAYLEKVKASHGQAVAKMKQNQQVEV